MKNAHKQYAKYLNYMATEEYAQNLENDEQRDTCIYARCFSTLCPRSKNPDQEELELRDIGFESLLGEDLHDLFNENDF